MASSLIFNLFFLFYFFICYNCNSLKDERNQILTTNCWLSLQWQDFHLQWNQEKYQGISVIRCVNGKSDLCYNSLTKQLCKVKIKRWYNASIYCRLPADRIWRPDIILYNNADKQYSSQLTSTNAIVTEVTCPE